MTGCGGAEVGESAPLAQATMSHQLRRNFLGGASVPWIYGAL